MDGVDAYRVKERTSNDSEGAGFDVASLGLQNLRSDTSNIVLATLQL